jgi:hypothetical protein
MGRKALSSNSLRQVSRSERAGKVRPGSAGQRFHGTFWIDLIANLHAGSILTAFGGIILPSGNRAHGLGTGVTTFESFAAFAQLLPALSFVQLQARTDPPTDTSTAPRAMFWRAALGKSFRQSGGLGRMWIPMTEFVANRDFTSHAKTDWDVIPQSR